MRIEKITILLKKRIESDLSGYEELIRILLDIKEVYNTLVVFDFKDVIFFEANLCAVLGTIVEILERNKNKIEIINLKNSVETILRKNEFLLPYGYSQIKDNYHTSIRYQKFASKNKNDDRKFEDYITKELLGKSDFPSHSAALGKQITLRVFELYENARTHGACDHIHTCGQYFPNKPDKPLNITIVDTGKTFKEIVSDFKEKNLSSIEAIEWGMKKGNTTKSDNISGGLGLDLIFQFIKHNKGKIQIISNNGFWEWSRNEVRKHELARPFPGTIANLRFNLNDDHYYILSSEKNSDWENLF